MSLNKSHKVLVIGGGDPTLYQNKNFYEIGDHDSSYFGKNKDWTKVIFWHALAKKFDEDHINFDAVIIDNGTESWLFDIPKDVLNIMTQIIICRMNPHAILITEIYDKNIINNLFLENGLHIVGSTYFNKCLQYKIYNILSRVSNLKLENQQGIYENGSICYIPILNHEGEDTGYKKPNKERAIEENQIDFCINRIINN